MKKLLLLAALAVAVATTGCSKEDGGNAETSGNLISMRAVMDKTDVSRASAITTERFTSFHVLASRDSADGDGNYQDLKYLNTAVWLTDTGWTYAPRAYYPADGTSLSFYAYAPIGDPNMTSPLSQQSDDVTFEYKVPYDQTTDLAEDLIVASVLKKASSDVTFQFKHALSAATFAAVNKNDPASELVYVITKIEITELDNEGTFTYSSAVNSEFEWDPFGNNNEDYVAPLPQSGVALEPTGDVAGTKTLLTANDFLILLPQTPTTWGIITDTSTGTFVKVTFNLRDGSGNFIYENEERYLEIPSALHSTGFVAGTRYKFTFTFGASNVIEMSATVSDWKDGEVAL